MNQSIIALKLPLFSRQTSVLSLRNQTIFIYTSGRTTSILSVPSCLFTAI